MVTSCEDEGGGVKNETSGVGLACPGLVGLGEAGWPTEVFAGEVVWDVELAGVSAGVLFGVEVVLDSSSGALVEVIDVEVGVGEEVVVGVVGVAADVVSFSVELAAPGVDTPTPGVESCLWKCQRSSARRIWSSFDAGVGRGSAATS